MDERERIERNRVPYDPATPGESATIHYALKTVLMGISEARRSVRGVRISTRVARAGPARTGCVHSPGGLK
jgi:hypothetical protein